MKFFFFLVAGIILYLPHDSAFGAITESCDRLVNIALTKHSPKLDQLEYLIKSAQNPESVDQWIALLDQIKKEGTELASSLETHELELIAKKMIHDLLGENSYLPGLSPNWNAQTLEEFMIDHKNSMSLGESSKMTNVIGNIDTLENNKYIILKKSEVGWDVSQIKNKLKKFSPQNIWQVSVFRELVKRWDEA